MIGSYYITLQILRCFRILGHLITEWGFKHFFAIEQGFMVLILGF